MRQWRTGVKPDVTLVRKRRGWEESESGIVS